MYTTMFFALAITDGTDKGGIVVTRPVIVGGTGAFSPKHAYEGTRLQAAEIGMSIVQSGFNEALVREGLDRFVMGN